MQSKFLVRVAALSVAFAIAVTGGGVAGAQPSIPAINSTATATVSEGETSTDYIQTPDGIAVVTEDLANETITVTDEFGETVVFNRAEIEEMAAQIPATVSTQDGGMMARAAVDSGTRAYLCNLFAGVAAGAQGWAWQTALAIAKVHPGVRLVVAGGQIAFWAFITTQC